MEEATQARQPVSPTLHRHRAHERALFHVPLSPAARRGALAKKHRAMEVVLADGMR
jgi:hypothetical protein